MIDPAWAKVVSDWALFLIGAIATGLAWAWLLLARRGEGVSSQAAVLEGRIDDHAQRLAAIEATQANQPNHSHIAALNVQVHDGLSRSHERMDRIGESLARVEGSLDGIKSVVARLNSHLMEHGPRAGEHPK